MQVVDSLDVSLHGTRVGLVQYSSRVRTEFALNMYHTADEIKAAVMKVTSFITITVYFTILYFEPITQHK